MTTSPFHARLAVASFVAVAAAVACNLLVMQTPRGPAAESRLNAERGRPMTDAERLSRLALEANSAPATALHRPSPPPDTQRAKRTDNTSQQRVGSFAPSSSSLSFTALPGADPAEARRATIRAVQGELARRGYEPGPADGTPALVTRAAVMAYEHDQGLPLTADPSPEVLAHLRHGTSAPGAAIGLDANAPVLTAHAEDVIRSAQKTLNRLGYLASSADGVASEETVRAIREFEMDAGLVPTGRISGPLMANLTRALAKGR